MKKIMAILVAAVLILSVSNAFAATTIKSGKEAEADLGDIPVALVGYQVKVLERHIQNPKTYSNIDAIVFWQEGGYNYISAQDSNKSIDIGVADGDTGDMVTSTNAAYYMNLISSNKLAPYNLYEDGKLVAIVFAMYPSYIQTTRRPDGSLFINITCYIERTQPFDINLNAQYQLRK